MSKNWRLLCTGVFPGSFVPLSTLQAFLAKAILDERGMHLSDGVFVTEKPGPIFYSNYDDPHAAEDYLLTTWTFLPTKTVTRTGLDTILRAIQSLLPHNIGLFYMQAYNRGQYKLMVAATAGGGYAPGSSGRGLPGGWDTDISSGEDSSPGEKS